MTARPTPVSPVQPPRRRGPLSGWVLSHRTGAAHVVPVPVPGMGFGEDLQLALYLCYELHYSDVPGLEGVDEWDPEVIAFRRTLETEFLRALTVATPDHDDRSDDRPVDVRSEIPAIIERDTAPSLSRHMEVDGTLDEMRTFVMHRSPYQLKEADPHTFGIPRLRGRSKQLLATIQGGEYGADDPDHVMHAELFAGTMRALALDDRPNAYLDTLPASALMVSNLISLFGLNRRWRGALVGHLAVFEMTSVVPMGRYAAALKRLGADAQARRFYDVHVLADAEHEVMALEMAAELASSEPDLARDILFGAECVNLVERMFAEQVLAGAGELGARTRSAA